MLIARLIADSFDEGTGDIESRLDAAGATFDAEEIPLASAVMIGLDVPVLELRFANGEPKPVLDIIDRHFSSSDTLVSVEEISIPHLFVSDMDSTMIEQECIDELADYAGIKNQIAAITERAMQGELDFESALRERVALLDGLEENAIARCLTERITASPGANVLSRTLAALGCRNVLVTGGFHHFADVVGDQLGFHRVVGNQLEVDGGRLTGGLVGDITDASTKRRVLEEEADRLGVNTRTLATGDGANDIPMIDSATYGFAYRAKPKARAAANGRIDRGDLTAILSLLGIDRKDWVEG